MMTKLIPLLLVCCTLCTLAAAARGESLAPPLPQAHSHNDYEHERPLFDALDRGFCNIEADVFLVDGQLLVGHDKADLRPERTLAALYLDPLRDRIAANGGKLFTGGERLTLLIDFKSDGPTTYAALAELLKHYETVISGMSEGEWTPRQVDVIVSGNRPIDEISQDLQRMAAIDGRLKDVTNADSARLMPLISDNWNDHFKWRGVGEMPVDERDRLRSAATIVNSKGKRLRFWGTPDTPAMWRELEAAGVGVIGTDDLDGLKTYFSHQD